MNLDLQLWEPCLRTALCVLFVVGGAAFGWTFFGWLAGRVTAALDRLFKKPAA